MRINSKKELQKFLEANYPKEGTYAIVTYGNNKEESIWFSVYENWTTDENGTPMNWYLEAPNVLFRTELTEPYEECLLDYAEELYENVDEKILGYLNEMVVDGYLYEIDSMQTAPFLPEAFDIQLVTERECLEWMLNHMCAKTW